MAKKTRIILILTVSLAAFLRFWQVKELFYFMIDEGRYSFLMKRIFIDHKLMLAGVAIPGGFYLGPLYFYVVGFLQWLYGFDPVKLGLTASLIGVISTLLTYIVGKKLFTQKTAIISAIIYATSYLTIIYNRIFWPLTWTSIASLFTYWGLYEVVINRRYRWLYIITGWLILGSHSDASYFSLILLVIVVLLRVKLPKIRRTIFIAITMFAILQTPVLIFDLRHGGQNIHRFISFLTPQKRAIDHNLISSATILPKTLARFLFISENYDITYQLAPLEDMIARREQAIHPVLLLLVTVILITFIIRPSPQFGYQMIKIHFAIAYLGVIAYAFLFPGYVHEWFFAILFPAFTFTIATSLELISIRVKALSLVILSLYMLANIRALLQSTNEFGYWHKQQAVKFAISQVNNQPFFIDSFGSQTADYRYLFWKIGTEPVHSYMDNIYGNWVYPLPPPNQLTTYGVIFVNFSPFHQESAIELAKAQDYRNRAIAHKKYGGIEVLIVPKQ